MILEERDLESYLNNDLEKISSTLYNKTLKKLEAFQEKIKKPIIDFLFTTHHNGKSLRALSKEIGIHIDVLTKIFDFYELPRLTNAEATLRTLEEQWTDEAYRERDAEAKRKARFEGNNLTKYHLPTISGIRRDIGYAQSTWEANLARIFLYCKRD